MTAVTAVLGALALSGVIWSWDTKRAEPWPQRSVTMPSAALAQGTTFQLHSGAWRARPAPAEDAPETAPVVLATPPAAAAETPRPEGSMPIQQTTGLRTDTSALPARVTHRVEPSTPAPQARATAQDEPSAPPLVDTAPAVPTPPPAEGRMALAGPDVEAPHPPTSHMGRSTPTGRSAPRAPEPSAEPEPVAPSESKFGPANLKQLERNGF
jgi:hypothetical protein